MPLKKREQGAEREDTDGRAGGRTVREGNENHEGKGEK